MSPEERAAIKARYEAASPAPWRARPHGRAISITSGMPGRDLLVVADIYGDTPDMGGTTAEPDADFIAAARTDVPALLAEVERLEAEHLKFIAEHNFGAFQQLEAERDAALADAARLRAALESWRVNFGTIDDTLRWMKQREDVLAAPAGDEALREFGLRVATQARKVHAHFGGSQVDAAAIVDAVLRGER